MRAGHPARSPGIAALLVLGWLAFNGCADSERDPVNNPGPGLIQVTGVVTLLNDQTPVDGGVTIQVTDSKRGSVTLWFESMYTNPPPRPERVALYQEIQKVSVGNTIRATARPDGTTSYKLESIEVVTPG